MSDEAFRPEEEFQHFTAEELELLAASTEELERRTRVFCFDERRFTERMTTARKWQQLLQAHLYFDHLLTKLLSESLENADALNVRRLGFSQRLQFLSALSVLSPELIAIVNFVNDLRIKMAYDLNFEIYDASVKSLENSTPQYLKDIILADEGRKPGPILFHELLRIVLLQLDIIRQDKALARLLRRKADLRVRAVVEGLPGEVYEVQDHDAS